ncbi:MAG: DUF3800 domain-containing protein [Ignavibacteria bacterium]|nr:DUF3800 domain-containing protein [Ignavibacteria bacterium]
MYTDESGDVGVNNSPTNYFILSSIIFQENHWLNLLNDIVNFRRDLKRKYGLKIKDEIHASEFISGNGLNANIKSIIKYRRLSILRDCLEWLNSRNEISIITVCADKSNGGDIFYKTWDRLIQRFENTLLKNNFPGPQNNDKGIVISDNTDGGKLTKLLRSKRKINFIPNTQIFSGGYRNLVLRNVIEDPILRDSRNSLFHQMVDVVAYFAKQHYQPNHYIKKQRAGDDYSRLNSVINPFVTRDNSFMKIVEI